MSRETRVVRDVPDAQVNFVVATMKADDAEVTKTSQGGGLWTITGAFPERESASAVPPAVGERTAAREPVAAAAADRTRDVDVLARTIWGEARGGSQLGMEAIAAVVLNRLNRNKPERFGGSIAEVCLKPNQFSCWNPGDPNLEKLKRVDETNREFLVCIEIAERAAGGDFRDPTKGSDHYHTVQVAPDWSRGKSPVRRIDDHVFFNDIA